MDGPAQDGPATREQDAAAAPSEEELARFERRDALVTMGRTWLLFPLGLNVAYVTSALLTGFHRVPPGWYLASTLVTLCGVYFPLVYSRLRRRMRGDIVCDDRGILLGGKLVRQRSRLRSGFLRKLPDGSLAVRVVGRYLYDALDVQVQGEQEGRAMLRALKLDRTHATAVFRIIEGGMRAAMGLAILGGALFCLGFLGLWLALARGAGPTVLGTFGVELAISFLCAVAFVLRGQTKVVVGSDGLLMKRSLGGSQYLPYSEVASAAIDESDVVLRLRSGQKMRLGLGHKRVLGQEHAGDALVMAIEDARAASAAQGPTQHAALVARGDRTIGEWLAALGKLTDAARASYRQAMLPRAQLWRIVEDVSSPPGTRAGAAVVLRSQLNDGDRARLRIAAEACASPNLRRALEAAAQEEDEAALEHALGSLEGEAR
jgi:hypothetical protein